MTTVDKALELLAGFPAGGRTAGVTELARQSGLTKSTVFRLLAAMERSGFVERDRGRYRLGRRLYDLGAQVYEPRPGRLYELLLPFMTDLYGVTRQTVHLGVLVDTEVALLGRLHGAHPVPRLLCIGSRFPAHCSALGKAMLAHSPEVADRVLDRGLAARTPQTITEVAEFRAELRQARERGVAISRGEARPGLSCVAVALLDEVRRPVAALSIAGQSEWFDVARNAALLRSVAAQARAVLRQAGREEAAN